LPTELLFYGGVEVSGNKILLKDNDTRILTLARDFPDEQNTLKGTSWRRTESQQQHPTTTPGHRHIDGPGILYHTITAIVELRQT
jgi:hypothetical protein